MPKSLERDLGLYATLPISIGTTRTGPVTQAVFGSFPETVGEQTDRTVVMARGPEKAAMSIREAIVKRLEI